MVNVPSWVENLNGAFNGCSRWIFELLQTATIRRVIPKHFMSNAESQIQDPPNQVISLPTFFIGPATSWTSIGLKELWDYRELLYFLTWRDVKVRYKQTALGAAWAIIQPVFMMAVS